MNGVNMVVVLGRLGDDPQVRHTQDGTAVANITLAVNERWNDKRGEKQEKVEWIRVVLWGKLAEVAENYLKKGDPAFVRGKLQTRSWEGKDGKKNYVTEVRADELQLLGGKADAGGGGERVSGRSKSRDEHSGHDDGDAPF